MPTDSNSQAEIEDTYKLLVHRERTSHRDNSFISSAGVLRDKKGIEQALTSVGLLHSFQTLLQGTAPAEQIKGISNLLSIFTYS